MHEIEVVAPAQEAVFRHGEFQDDEPSAGLEHAQDLLQRRFAVREIADAKGDGDHVETPVLPAHLLAVSLLAGDPLRESGLLHLPAHHREHPFGQVQPRDAAAGMHPAGDGKGEVARPAGDVEDPLRPVRGHDLPERAPAPAPVHAEGHQVVEAVVVGSDPVEHLLDFLFLRHSRI